jgi:hypothetical protein
MWGAVGAMSTSTGMPLAAAVQSILADPVYLSRPRFFSRIFVIAAPQRMDQPRSIKHRGWQRWS